MKTQYCPFIKISRGMSSPDKSSTQTENCREGYQAIWGTRILLHPYEELVKLQLGWSARDLANEMMERQQGLLETLYRICHRTPVSSRFSLRFVQQAGGAPLSIFLFVKVMARSEYEVRLQGERLWTQIHSIFPYDYDVEPLTSAEEMDQCAGMLEQHHEFSSGAVIYPFVRTFGRFSRLQGYRRGILMFGSWDGSLTSPENIWRALHQAQDSTVMDILIEPTIVKYHEIQYLLSSAEHLADETYNDKFLEAIMKEQVSATNQRLVALQKAFLVQVRLATKGDVSTITRSISSALTTKKWIDGKPSQLEADIFHLRDQKASQLAKKIAEMDYIRVHLAFHPALQRIPFIATIPEAYTVFRLPILPKGGIPGLQMEYLNRVTA